MSISNLCQQSALRVIEVEQRLRRWVWLRSGAVVSFRSVAAFHLSIIPLCKDSSGLVFHYIVRAHGNHWDTDLIRFSPTFFFPNFHSLEGYSHSVQLWTAALHFLSNSLLQFDFSRKALFVYGLKWNQLSFLFRAWQVGAEPQKM